MAEYRSIPGRKNHPFVRRLLDRGAGHRAGPVTAGAAALCVVLGGCGGGATDDLPRRAVAGTVTLNGRPLDSGVIRFEPLSVKDPVVAGALITGGAYSIPRDQGLVPGTYSVTISSVAAEAPAGAPAPPGPPDAAVKGPGERVPEKYNTRTRLTAKVEAGKTDPINFALEP